MWLISLHVMVNLRRRRRLHLTFSLPTHFSILQPGEEAKDRNKIATLQTFRTVSPRHMWCGPIFRFGKFAKFCRFYIHDKGRLLPLETMCVVKAHLGTYLERRGATVQNNAEAWLLRGWRFSMKVDAWVGMVENLIQQLWLNKWPNEEECTYIDDYPVRL